MLKRERRFKRDSRGEEKTARQGRRKEGGTKVGRGEIRGKEVEREGRKEDGTRGSSPKP